ncbi:uncharacterized protein LOC126884353 [Diabrotica virgifera virgifera]|uniref:Regulatory protein zeste n=1 Tax=Diabrotica virgifera virgifera TaxID=50390 RepID=A0ABM5K7S6_DIAVI|nr:uncharacterized protein LOC126884353 [Diabrotica virgifera virgifera]
MVIFQTGCTIQKNCWFTNRQYISGNIVLHSIISFESECRLSNKIVKESFVGLCQLKFEFEVDCFLAILFVLYLNSIILAMENKGSHFSSLEKDIILDLAIKYKCIIENKQTDGVTNKQKAIAWENISKEFNAMNVNTHRTSKQIKTFYENIKRKIKKKQAIEKVEKYKTGGGPEETTNVLLPGEERLVGALKEQFKPGQNVYDSSTSFYEGSTNNINSFGVSIEDIEIVEHLDDSEINMSNSAESQNCSQMVHGASQLQTSTAGDVHIIAPVPVLDTPGPSTNKTKMQKEKKLASKRKLCDLYEDISSLTTTKKNKMKLKEDYIKEQQTNKEDIYIKLKKK